MKELRITDWREFQNIGCFWMQHLVESGTNRSIKYYVYGNDGEGQGGVDLVPEDPCIGIVGQSKCWNSKVLYWGKIEEDLKKTNDFPGLITHYVILTTAPRHTSIQQQMPSDVCSYERKQGSFQVRIYYWDELQNLDFLPQYLLQRVFPRAFALAVPAEPSGPSLANYAQSLQHARTFLPMLIPTEYLEWLAKWDFTQGYVPAKYFDLFYSLNIQIDRVKKAVAHPQLRDWLNEGNRLQLSMCLPAAAPVFSAIQEFAQAVTLETVSKQLSDGDLVYEHGHNPSAALRITNGWKSCAEVLLYAYRTVVEGVSPS